MFLSNTFITGNTSETLFITGLINFVYVPTLISGYKKIAAAMYLSNIVI